jgi:hypothetical protein
VCSVHDHTRKHVDGYDTGTLLAYSLKGVSHTANRNMYSVAHYQQHPTDRILITPEHRTATGDAIAAAPNALDRANPTVPALTPYTTCSPTPTSSGQQHPTRALTNAPDTAREEGSEGLWLLPDLKIQLE